ncbi:hypothetical protein [Magnetospirillum gryphiswaldense]|uniref:Uncharacterized protein n=1 Tax=Magnetospirillum gryphiswaldense (strain DSM 6361 / JCM 21280 / NBRC 15271 / MSR-1) TaxID=431944 RepID=V6F0Z2_MAGGM|nr:hypothetical protein [Magnetospirillum gryphiswaldense]AVM74118.1 hypothetical protein MSR1_16260 [Magnetospirillum gryphiswaldense MSR-1]AVM78021.1 hypothetical protein MSR1L_16260 [Magnetospirillum gryphiswaldense]CDK97951.1 conserved protein of unknown function [Magnetospirillum gryphiswaldense MSR-1 v2]
MAQADLLAQMQDWVAIYGPPPLRTELLAALNNARAENGDPPGPADYWQAVAELLVAKGHLDVAREAIKRWQMLAPADHPIHAVMGGGPPPEEKPPAPPPPPKPEPNSRIVRVIDTTYTFQRIEPQMDKVQGRKVKACWETFLDENDKSSRAVVNTFEDGACGPWAVTGVFTDFAGAAAVEVVVRSMQRHFVFTTKKDAKVRKLLAGFGLPLMTVLGVFIGYIMGVLH